MENSFMAKIVFLFVAICLTNYASAPPPTVEEKTILANCICQLSHWRNLWCKEVNTYTGWTSIGEICNVSLNQELNYKLKTIAILMGCGYVENLAHFLRLTTYTINECKVMSYNGQNPLAGDCWGKLTGSFVVGKLTMLRLMSAMEHIWNLNITLEQSPFYSIFWEIQRFLDATVPRAENTFDEITTLNIQITTFAMSLDELMENLCRPKRFALTPDQILNEFVGEHNIHVLYQNAIVIYPFCINKLNTYIGFIDQHLFQLGYRTTEPGGHIVHFLMPDGTII